MLVSQNESGHQPLDVRPRDPNHAVSYWLLDALREPSAVFTLSSVNPDEMRLIVRAFQGEIEILEQQLQMKQVDFDAWSTAKVELDTLALYLRTHYVTQIESGQPWHKGTLAECVIHYLACGEICWKEADARGEWEKRMLGSWLGRLADWWTRK